MVYSPPSNTLAIAVERRRNTERAYQAAVYALPIPLRHDITAYVAALAAEAAARRAHAKRLQAALDSRDRGTTHKKNGTS